MIDEAELRADICAVLERRIGTPIHDVERSKAEIRRDVQAVLDDHDATASNTRYVRYDAITGTFYFDLGKVRPR